MEALCGEDENSFINRWGGEPIYDNYHVTINSRGGRGSWSQSSLRL